MSLAAAGTAFAVLQAVGMVARILMGFLADRLGSAVRTLICLASLQPRGGAGGEPQPRSALGAGAGGERRHRLHRRSWNGVFLAEVARLAPEGRVSEVTSAPPSSLSSLRGGAGGVSARCAGLGGYGPCFLAIAVLPLISAACCCACAGWGRKPPPTER